MHSWHVLEQTKTQLVTADKLKSMAHSKGRSYMEEKSSKIIQKAVNVSELQIVRGQEQIQGKYIFFPYF